MHVQSTHFNTTHKFLTKLYMKKISPFHFSLPESVQTWNLPWGYP